jgi:hypothetical protein
VGGDVGIGLGKPLAGSLGHGRKIGIVPGGLGIERKYAIGKHHAHDAIHHLRQGNPNP